MKTKIMRQDEFTEKWQGLTATPRSVLTLLLEGKTDEEIAKALHGKTATVRKHIQMLCDRFELKREVNGIKHNRREDLIALFAQHMPQLVNPQISLTLHNAVPATSNLQAPKPDRDWGEAPDVSIFYGREEELATLKQWIVGSRCRLVALLGMGGIGKTALSVKLAQEIQGEFDYAIWRSLRQLQSLKELLAELIQFLSGQQKPDIPNDDERKISQLIKYFKQHRCLLVLDSLETILESGKLAGTYLEEYKNFGNFLLRVGQEPHQSCLLITSRDKTREIALLSGKTGPVRTINLCGLKDKDARNIFQDKGLSGEKQWSRLIKLYLGNPLALKMIAARIKDLLQGNVEEFFKQEMSLLTLDFEVFIEEQFTRLSPLELQIIYQLAIENQPLAISSLPSRSIFRESLDEIQNAVESLLRRSLIEIQSGNLTTQPVVMEYVSKRLTRKIMEEIAELDRTKNREAIDLLKILDLNKNRKQQEVGELTSSPMGKALKKELGKNYISEREFLEKINRILSMLEIEKFPQMGYAEPNFNYLKEVILSNSVGSDRPLP